jgi:dihydroneopterin aldolase
VSLDLIQLRGLRVVGICGALPEERERAQPLEIDLDVTVDLSTAAASDALRDTIDYGALVASAEQVVLDSRFVLLEALAGRLADVALTDPRVHAVTVSVRKLRPPVPQHLETAGVRLTRTRPAD